MFLQIFKSINEKATDYGKWALVSIGMIQEEKRMKPIFGYFPVQAVSFCNNDILFFCRIHTYILIISN